MKVTFLGTGTSQGVPVIACNCNVCTSSDKRDNRLRSALMIENAGVVLVIDAGPDFRQQMLREKVKNLDAILITHEHKDHVGGLDDIRAFNYIQKKSIDVYADWRVQRAIKRDFPYVFAENKYPGVPQMNLHLVEDKLLTICGIDIQPIEVLHHKLPVKAYRIGDFTYITDAKTISESEKVKIKGTKVLVVNALHHKKHLSHFSLEEALSFIKQINPKRAFLIHASHRMGLYKDVAATLPQNVTLAYDGLSLTI